MRTPSRTTVQHLSGGAAIPGTTPIPGTTLRRVTIAAKTYIFTSIHRDATVSGDPYQAEAAVRSWFPDAGSYSEQWLDDLFLELRRGRLDEPAATALGLEVARV